MEAYNAGTINQMKISIYILSLALFIGCNASDRTYEAGIENCNSDMKHYYKFSGGDSTLIGKSWKGNCIVGYKLPDFKVTTIIGDTISNSSLKGKMSIINFWFETCSGCVAEMPALNQLKNKYGDGRINYIAIGNDTKSDIELFIKKKPFNFEHVANGEPIFRKTFQSGWGYPYTIVTDTEGTIISAFGGYKETMRYEIEALIDQELNF